MSEISGGANKLQQNWKAFGDILNHRTATPEAQKALKGADGALRNLPVIGDIYKSVAPAFT